MSVPCPFSIVCFEPFSRRRSMIGLSTYPPTNCITRRRNSSHAVTTLEARHNPYRPTAKPTPRSGAVHPGTRNALGWMYSPQTLGRSWLRPATRSPPTAPQPVSTKIDCAPGGSLPPPQRRGGTGARNGTAPQDAPGCRCHLRSCGWRRAGGAPGTFNPPAWVLALLPGQRFRSPVSDLCFAGITL